MRKSDLIWLAAILFVAAGLRLWAPWDDVLGARVSFLENDSWYHVRLAENQVRNFPHRVTVDPYASPGGQYVAVAPLLDTIIATAAVVTQGRDATTEHIERVAALVPAVVGVLAVAAVWALATLAFDRRAGLIAGLLAAILPGHFLDRTLVGFVDHHALEVLLSFAAAAALVHASVTGAKRSAAIAGICLGLYLLAWASGAYFIAILTLWIVLAAVVCAPKDAIVAATSGAIAAATALAIVLVFQDPALFRYNTQLAAIAGLLTASLAVMFFASRIALALAVLAGLGVVIMGAAWLFAPSLVQQVVTDLSRFRPDPTRMAVLEARPLFLYTGNWTWSQPWVFFRSGFYAGIIAVAGLAITLWRSRRADHLLIVCMTVAHYLATIGQNRFGYYLVPATAVVCGWLATQMLDWGGVPHAGNPSPLDFARGSPEHRRRAPKVRRPMPFQREIAVIAVAGVIVAPNIVPAAITTTREGGMPEYWFEAMRWLRVNTPEPFESPDYYYARYDAAPRPAGFTIMNWWDQGYWIIQTARRVPVSNPTQSGAPIAAAFLTATDEAEALAMLTPHRARYVMVDWELPFREAAGGSLGGRFQNLADWAGIPTERYYTLCYSRANDAEPWQPTWLFREAYYQTMAYRLMVLGGGAVTPANNTYLVEIRERQDITGRRFCEVASRTPFATADEAREAARSRGANFQVVGLTPWLPAFPVEAIAGLKTVAEFKDPTQKAGESPMVRIFEVTGDHGR